MSILDKVLEKKGIKDVTKLSKEEAEDFDRWERILSEGEMTLDKVAEFCDSQVTIIERQWANLDNSNAKNERLILLHTVYSKIKGVITSPQAEKEQLEKYLQQLLVDKH